MKNYNIKIVAVTLLLSINLFSQKYQVKKIKSFLRTPWIFEIGFNAIDDDGDKFKGLLDLNFADDKNIVKYPSRFGVTKYLNYGFKVQLVANFNIYKVGAEIDKGENLIKKNIFTMELTVNYNLNELIKINKWAEPYIAIGYGYTKRGIIENPNHNAGIGSNFWLYKNLGLNIQMLGKWTLKDRASNYVQYSAGFIYKIGKKKEIFESEAHKKAKSRIRKIIWKK